MNERNRIEKNKNILFKFNFSSPLCENLLGMNMSDTACILSNENIRIGS